MKYIKSFLLIKIIFNLTNIIANDPELNYIAVDKLEKKVSIAPYFLDEKGVTECINNFKPKLKENDLSNLLDILTINCNTVQNSYKKRFANYELLKQEHKLESFQSTVTLKLLSIAS